MNVQLSSGPVRQLQQGETLVDVCHFELGGAPPAALTLLRPIRVIGTGTPLDRDVNLVVRNIELIPEKGALWVTVATVVQSRIVACKN